MPVTSRYKTLRDELIDYVFETAFPPNPYEPVPPDELYALIVPVLEQCSCWDLLRRIRILEPDWPLARRVGMMEAISNAAQMASKQSLGRVPKVFSQADLEQERRDEEEANREFGSPAIYREDSKVLYLKVASLLESVAIEDAADPEAKDEHRQVKNGTNLVQFIFAFLNARQPQTSTFINWRILKSTAADFDRQIEESLKK